MSRAQQISDSHIYFNPPTENRTINTIIEELTGPKSRRVDALWTDNVERADKFYAEDGFNQYHASELFYRSAEISQARYRDYDERLKSLEQMEDVDPFILEFLPEELYRLRGSIDYYSLLSMMYGQPYFDMFFTKNKGAIINSAEDHIERVTKRADYGTLDLLYPFKSLSQKDINIAYDIIGRNYQLFFDGISKEDREISIRLFMMDSQLLSRAFCNRNVAVCTHRSTIVGPKQFAWEVNHESTHAMAHELFGYPAFSEFRESITMLLDRYWFPDQVEHLGRGPGYIEMNRVFDTHSFDRSTRIAYGDVNDIPTRQLHISQTEDTSELYYRTGFNIFAAVIDYLRYVDPSSSEEDRIRMCVQIYADTCSKNITGAKKKFGFLPNHDLVRDGAMTIGTKPSDVIMNAIRKNGINPSDPRLLGCLHRWQLSDRTAYLYNKYHH